FAQQSTFTMDDRLAHPALGHPDHRRRAGIRLERSQAKGLEPRSVCHHSGTIQNIDDLVVVDRNSRLERDLGALRERGELVEISLVHDITDPHQATLVLGQIRESTNHKVDALRWCDGTNADNEILAGQASIDEQRRIDAEVAHSRVDAVRSNDALAAK